MGHKDVDHSNFAPKMAVPTNSFLWLYAMFKWPHIPIFLEKGGFVLWDISFAKATELDIIKNLLIIITIKVTNIEHLIHARYYSENLIWIN